LTKILEKNFPNNQPEEDTEMKPKGINNRAKEELSTCQFHLGYLSEREQKQQIPEDCIVCKDIVDCMLKKMRT
jgi:hypothetical protein